MRLAQTGGYGILPNPAMPSTFLAQAGDLDDPWGNISCYHEHCYPDWTVTPKCASCKG
jgi:hypothetical protein